MVITGQYCVILLQLMLISKAFNQLVNDDGDGFYIQKPVGPCTDIMFSDINTE